jgi:arylsulfatase A-like enzyme
MKEFNRREFVKQGAGVAGVSMLPPAIRSVGKSKPISGSRPNIVVIMVDDMGFSDIGCYGSEIPTPNIDKLAAEGLRFTQFYNCGRCCPTRASLLTGLYPHQVGIGLMVKDYHTRGYTGDLSSKCVTIAEALQLGGYRTAMSGKWHVTPPELESKHNWPLQRGFERPIDPESRQHAG